MAINKYNVVESGNVGLGQAGAILETGTTVISGKKIIAFSFISDTIFTTLTPESGTNLYIGDSNNNGDTSDSITFPQGMTIYGRWSAFTLASGKVIAYLG